MKTKRLQKIWAAVLTMAMLASLITLPAHAAEGDITGEFGDVVDFTTGDFQTEAGIPTGNSEEAYTSGFSFKGMTITKGFRHDQSQYGLEVDNGGSIVVPVTKECDIVVTSLHDCAIQMGDDENTLDESTMSGQPGVACFHYTGSGPNVTLNIKGTSWITGISVQEHKGPYESHQWNFNSESGFAAAFPDGKLHAGVFDGLLISGAKDNNGGGTCLATGSENTIRVPLAGPSTVTVNGNWNWWFYFEDETTKVCTHSDGGGTGTNSHVYASVPESGYATIVFPKVEDNGELKAKSSYLYSIKVEKYTAPKTLAAGTYDFSNEATFDDNMKASFTGYTYNSGHGSIDGAKGTFKFILPVKSDITVKTCRHGMGTNLTLTSTSGEVSTETWDESGANGAKFVITGAEAGDLSLTLGGTENQSVYIHSIEVAAASTGGTTDPSREAITAGEYIFGTQAGTVNITWNETSKCPIVAGITWPATTAKDGQHGVRLNDSSNNGLTVHIPTLDTGKKGKITLETCCFGDGLTDNTITVSAGTVGTPTDTSEENNSSPGTFGKTIVISEIPSESDLVITLKQGAWLHSLKFESYTPRAAVEEKTYIFGTQAGTVNITWNETSKCPIVAGITWPATTAKNDQHGVQLADNTNNGFTVNIPTLDSGKKGKITLETCCFGNGLTDNTITVSAGTVGTPTDTSEENNSSPGTFGKTIVISEIPSESDLVITLKKGAWLHSLKFEVDGGGTTPSDPSTPTVSGDAAEGPTYFGKYASEQDSFSANRTAALAGTISGILVTGLAATGNGSDHGLLGSSGKIYVNMKQAGYIQVTGCNYGPKSVITSDKGTVVKSTAKEAGNDAPVYTIYGLEAGPVELTVKGTTYISIIDVEYKEYKYFDIDNDDVSLQMGETEDATVTVSAVNVGTVSVESKDANVVTANLNADGKTVELHAVGAGSTTVEVTATGSDETKIINVTVTGSGVVIAIDEGYHKTGKFDGSNGDVTEADVVAGKVKGLKLTGFADSGSGHGPLTNSSGTITITMEKKGTITIRGCCYDASDATMTVDTANSVADTTIEKDAKGVAEEDGKAAARLYTVDVPAAGKVVLNVTGKTYLSGVTVSYAALAGERKIDVWDLAGKEESNTELYINHITPAEWAKTAVTGGAVKANVVFGDLTVMPNANSSDVVVSNVTSSAWGSALTPADNAFTTKIDDDYTPAGGFVTSGGGHNKRRLLTIDNVKAGDKIVAYVGENGSADITYGFETKNTASTPTGADRQTALVTKGSKGTKIEFVTPATGNYMLWDQSQSGKPVYLRVMRIPPVVVSGTVKTDGVSNFPSTPYKVRFTNLTTKQITEVDVKNGKFETTLAPGYTYNANLRGAKGFAVSQETKVVKPTNAEVITGKSGVELVAVVQPTVTYSGTYSGFADSYDLSKLTMTMVCEDTDVEDVILDLDKTAKTFTGDLIPEAEYTVELGGVNDYQVSEPALVKIDANSEGQSIKVTTKPVYAVTGKLVDLPSNASVTLKFENVEDKYTYSATVSNGSYTASLRDGAYAAKATVDGWSTKGHVVVSGKATEKDILFVSTASKPAVTWVADVYVGHKDKANNYDTIRDAVDAISRMGVRSEDKRVTVHIAPGTYREQVIIKDPYITFTNDDAGEVLLTWYYGIGYKYYSSNGFYDAERAFDKYEKKIADRWGCTVQIKSGGTGFRAEGITFENSFNRYLTEEELADGVEVSGTESIKVVREYGVDVQSGDTVERAAAMCVEADNCEFYKCSFLSSQDTLYTQGKAYFKHCVIEGETDYIFGSGNVVFDACDLSWKGYSESSKAGYVTANRPQDTPSQLKGYLFRNCVVTGNSKLDVTPGYWGRTWGADATVILLNTKLESARMIDESQAGWTKMNGDPENANLAEYNTTAVNGDTLNLSKRTTGTVKDKAFADGINVTDWFGSWTPVYFTEEKGTIAFTEDPYITDNGDLNTPYPGHTLTVHYSIGDNDVNDASIIQWYRVAADGTETLVKGSTAIGGKDYKIAKGDVGCKIKVVVTPGVISDKTGTAKSNTIVETVQEGYEDPTGGSSGELGEGVKVYLAGDSTVCLYASRNEGSWGEQLQNFFNKDQVSIANYATGGRSTRNFINEGKLDAIAAKIQEGDYFFIQFGHNDCANETDEYLKDRYVPLGEPVNGIYPVTAGTKGSDGKYTYDCGGTYKWFLKQYIDVAKKAGATPVLVTPVARMYYTSDGTIRPHHDASSVPNADKTNSYVTAVKQLAQEENVLLIDGFTLTKTMFEDAYKACNGKTYGNQIMHDKGGAVDSTHCNKLGGIIEAAIMAKAIQGTDLPIAKAVKAPASASARTTDNKLVFSVDPSGKLSAFDITSGYVDHATYWEGVGQKLFDEIGAASGAGPVVPKLNAKAGGWFETIAVEIKDVADADVTAVSWTGTATGALAGDDLKYLVRDMTGGVRIDIPGLKAGTYTVKVTVNGNSYEFKDIKVEAYDRSGFAHFNWSEGVGAYKDDGTLKSNAVVLYVTEDSKETVSLTAGGITVTGIGNILNCKGWRMEHNNEKLLQKLYAEGRPLVVRIIGKVTAPEGVTAKASTAHGGSTKDNGGMCIMEYGGNITIEGIGTDATVDGWGFSFSAGGTGSGENKKGGNNFEVRNVTFRNVPEDCVGIIGEVKKNTDGTLVFDSPAEHIWVHNNEFYVPHISNPAESDKAEGDGAVDFRNGQYMTMSYNYFEGYHKTSLIGGNDTDDAQYHVTWHHNYWKDVQSRSPLARVADMHIYNNLYEGQTSYCMSLRANTYIFSEFNTFLNCNNPVVDEKSGGVCKSWSDVFTNCKGTNNAIIATSKTQTVESKNPYANFDTDPACYVAKGNYILDTAAAAVEKIKTYGGTMDCELTVAPEGGTVDPGKPGEVAVTGVTLNLATLKLPVKGTATLIATVAPDDATNKNVTWTSSASGVATVDSTGKVTAVASGTAIITVKTVSGGKTAKCEVTIPSAGGTTTTEEKTYVLDAATDLEVAVAGAAKAVPAGTKKGDTNFFTALFSNKSKVDGSQNKKFPDDYVGTARFSPQGKATTEGASVKFTTEGPATVKVWWVQGGSIEYNSDGSVKSDNDVRNMIILGSDGKEVTKTAETKETSMKNQAMISTLKLEKAGTYYLGGDINNNYIFKVEVTETVTTVVPGTDDTVWAESVAVAPASTSVEEGSTVKLTATITPENATDKTISWSSGNAAVATVDKDGVVTGVKEGTAVITATTADGKTASCTVTVTKKGESGGGSMVPTGTVSSGGSSAGGVTVTNPDGSKTTTTTAKDGTVTAVTVGKDGSKLQTVTTKAGDKTITFVDAKGETQVAISLPATIPAPKEKFSDVPTGHWAENAINAMAGLGMINGVSSEANIFDMTSAITRGSIATILFRFSNGTAGKTNTFSDVASGVWYTDAIGWASGSGVVTGYADGTFGPNDTITREQLAVMISRFAKLIGMPGASDAAALNGFVDGSATSSWAVEGMAWCVKNGIITGKLGGVLDPTAQVSRAEAAVMFDRMIGMLK